MKSAPLKSSNKLISNEVHALLAALKAKHRTTKRDLISIAVADFAAKTEDEQSKLIRGVKS